MHEGKVRREFLKRIMHNQQNVREQSWGSAAMKRCFNLAKDEGKKAASLLTWSRTMTAL